jgi:hypothetical protein
MENYLVTAIQKLKPNTEFSYTDNDYSTIKWIKLEGTAPTQAEIDVAIEQVKTEEAQAEASKATAKAALLTQLGITAEQAKLLLS